MDAGREGPKQLCKDDYGKSMLFRLYGKVRAMKLNVKDRLNTFVAWNVQSV